MISAKVEGIYTSILIRLKLLLKKVHYPAEIVFEAEFFGQGFVRRLPSDGFDFSFFSSRKRTKILLHNLELNSDSFVPVAIGTLRFVPRSNEKEHDR